MRVLFVWQLFGNFFLFNSKYKNISTNKNALYFFCFYAKSTLIHEIRDQEVASSNLAAPTI